MRGTAYSTGVAASDSHRYSEARLRWGRQGSPISSTRCGAGISSITMISRTSAMHYKGLRKSLPQIARELHVEAVVEGSVLMNGVKVGEGAVVRNAILDAGLKATDIDGMLDYSGGVDDCWTAACQSIVPAGMDMASLVESGLTNMPGGDRDSMGFFQMRTSIWDEGPYKGFAQNPDLQVRWFIDQALAVVSGGRVVATAASEDGAAELTSVPDADALGIYRLAGRESADPLTCIEEDIALIRPASRPLVLFNSNLVESELRLLSRVEGADLLAVRMRVTESSRAIRARLRKAGLRDSVVDARAVLDEGSALDVGNDLDSVRLARVATRMRAAGFPVAAIVYQGAFTPSTIGFAAIRPEQLPSNLSLELPSRGIPSLGQRLDATTGAPLIAGNRIELELDNATARGWLLEAIAAALALTAGCAHRRPDQIPPAAKRGQAHARDQGNPEQQPDDVRPPAPAGHRPGGPSYLATRRRCRCAGCR